MGHEETDIVVLGAGAAGLTTAITAHDHGAEVLVLEKSAYVGGTSAISGGVIWAPNNHHQAALGIEDSREEALSYFEALSHGQMDPDLISAFVDICPEAIAYVEKYTPASFSILEGYPDYYVGRPGSKAGGGRSLDNDLFAFDQLGEWGERVLNNGPAVPMMLKESPVGGGHGVVPEAELNARAKNDSRGMGQALVGSLLKGCLDRGIEPKLNVSVGGLVMDGNRVSGVRLSDGVTEIGARNGVIISTGGFEWNAEMAQTFLRGPMTHPASPPMNKGDGLRLALAAGADLGAMTGAWWVPTIAIPGDEWMGEQRATLVLIERTSPHSIIVNREGKRFCNEATNYSAIAGAFHYLEPNSYDYVNLPAWLVFDHAYKMKYPVAAEMPGPDVPDWIVKGETPEELARALGIKEDALADTISHFNGLAAQGRDTDYKRGESTYDHFYGDRQRDGSFATLGPLEEPPFYAVELHMGCLGTNGGAKTDVLARVLDAENEVIPGLYAAGNAMASATGSVYAGAGGTLGPALTFGYIAGRDAARRKNI